MRRKELMNRLGELVDSLETLNAKLQAAEEENTRLHQTLAQLQTELCDEPQDERLSETQAVEEAQEPVESPDEPIVLDDVMEYGSRIIGMIVVESAKYADQISGSAGEDKKDLINLIMGKTEVCKAEILSITLCDAADESKRSLIDSQYTEAIDYFKSVVAQL